MNLFLLKSSSYSSKTLVFLRKQEHFDGNISNWVSTDNEISLSSSSERRQEVHPDEDYNHWIASKSDKIIGRSNNLAINLSLVDESERVQSDDNTPPTGLWTLDKTEYEGSYLETSTDLLSKEYLEQEKLRDWDSLIHRIERLLPKGDSMSADTDNNVWKDKVVIDVGCGAGAISKRFLSRGTKTVIGIDRDPMMVGVSKILCDTHSERRGESSGKFHVSDVSEPPVHLLKERDGTADVIWTSFVIAYFNNPLQFVQQWSSSNILKPGGLLCVIEIDGLFSVHNPLDQDIKDIAIKLDKSLEPLYFTHYGSQLSRFCQEAGLEVLVDECIEDAELAFDGPVKTTSVLEAWTSRLNRPGISGKLSKCTDNPQLFREKFLGCLVDMNHSVSSRPRIVIARQNKI